ncbi:MAG: exodeoxyribonuclease VII small subunit [Bacteroidaceae bacterium]|nr:exodeoxyribonuclease VII small subunit [Bacteroidaceae bacterium]
MKDEITYKKAVQQLEQIVNKLENGELDIDTMTEQLKEAQHLIKFCKDKLTKADEDINKILEKK